MNNFVLGMTKIGYLSSVLEKFFNPIRAHNISTSFKVFDPIRMYVM